LASEELLPVCIINVTPLDTKRTASDTRVIINKEFSSSVSSFTERWLQHVEDKLL
jgi:hypothetical protein